MSRKLGWLFVAAMLLGISSVQAQDTVLELWANRAPNPENARGAALKFVLDDFEAKHPGVKVNVTVIDYLEMSPSLLRAVRAQQPPDIAMLYSPFIRAHMAAGTLEPLDAIVNSDAGEDVIILPIAQADGHTYALPWEIRVMGLIYRADLFAEAGAPFPKTHGELVAALKAIQAKHGMGGYGVSFDPVRSIGALEWFTPLAVGLGAKVLNDDGTAAFNDPAVITLLETLKGLVADGVIDPASIFISGDEMQQRFEGGRVPMFSDGTHQLESSREATGLGEAVAFAPVPDFDADHQTPALVQGWNLVIPKGSPHPDLAAELIEHWISAEIQAEQTRQAGYLPANRQVAGSDEFNDSRFEHVRRAFTAIDRGTFDFNWPENSELLNDVLSRMIAEVLTDKATVADAISNAERAYNEHLN